MGGSAGAAAAAATTPLDVIKTRMMCSASTRPTLRGAVAAVMAEGQGARAFFRGVVPRAVSNGLNSAVFFCFFEAIRRVRRAGGGLGHSCRCIVQVAWPASVCRDGVAWATAVGALFKLHGLLVCAGGRLGQFIYWACWCVQGGAWVFHFAWPAGVGRASDGASLCARRGRHCMGEACVEDGRVAWFVAGGMSAGGVYACARAYYDCEAPLVRGIQCSHMLCSCRPASAQNLVARQAQEQLLAQEQQGARQQQQQLQQGMPHQRRQQVLELEVEPLTLPAEAPASLVMAHHGGIGAQASAPQLGGGSRQQPAAGAAGGGSGRLACLSLAIPLPAKAGSRGGGWQ